MKMWKKTHLYVVPMIHKLFQTLLGRCLVCQKVFFFCNILGYEPAGLTMHPPPPPKRSRVGSFFRIGV